MSGSNGSFVKNQGLDFSGGNTSLKKKKNKESFDEKFQRLFPKNDYFTKTGKIKKMFSISNYSEEHLSFFENLIAEKLLNAEKEFENLENSHKNNSGNGTDDTAPTFKPNESGAATMSKEINVMLALRQKIFISDLKNALVRIYNKNYGRCYITGVLISPYRLKLSPHATLSIEAKKRIKSS